MRGGTVATLAVLAVLVVAGVAYGLLGTSAGGAARLSGDAGCPPLVLGGPPRGAPAEREEFLLVDGEPFVLEMRAGVWRAQLEAEGSMLRTSDDDRAWGPSLTRVWCRAAAGTETYPVRGNGTLVIERWTGADARVVG